MPVPLRTDISKVNGVVEISNYPDPAVNGNVISLVNPTGKCYTDPDDNLIIETQTERFFIPITWRGINVQGVNYDSGEAARAALSTVFLKAGEAAAIPTLAQVLNQNQSADGQQINVLGVPTDDNQAATKVYVDNNIYDGVRLADGISQVVEGLTNHFYPTQLGIYQMTDNNSVNGYEIRLPEPALFRAGGTMAFFLGNGLGVYDIRSNGSFPDNAILFTNQLNSDSYIVLRCFNANGGYWLGTYQSTAG